MNNDRKIGSVKEIKELIDKVIPSGYSYKTNFSDSDFLVDINYKLIIAARLIEINNKMVYEFVLDTQFVSDAIITYDELNMITQIIKILEDNRGFVLKRLKKYTVEEYKIEQEEIEKRSEIMLESLKAMIQRNYEKENDFDYYNNDYEDFDI